MKISNIYLVDVPGVNAKQKGEEILFTIIIGANFPDVKI